MSEVSVDAEYEFADKGVARALGKALRNWRFEEGVLRDLRARQTALGLLAFDLVYVAQGTRSVSLQVKASAGRLSLQLRGGISAASEFWDRLSSALAELEPLASIAVEENDQTATCLIEVHQAGRCVASYFSDGTGPLDDVLLNADDARSTLSRAKALWKQGRLQRAAPAATPPSAALRIEVRALEAADPWVMPELPPRPATLLKFSDSTLRFRAPSGWLDLDGRIVHEPNLNYVDEFADGLAYGQIDSQHPGYFIDLEGRRALDLVVATEARFHQGRAIVWYCVATDGTSPAAGELGPAELAQYRMRRCGVIDLKGRFLHQLPEGLRPQAWRRPAATEVPLLVDGLMPVAIRPGADQTSGFADERGTIVIAPTFHRASNFHGGRALVTMRDDEHGFIDASGSVLFLHSCSELRDAGEAIAKAYSIDETTIQHLGPAGEQLLEMPAKPWNWPRQFHSGLMAVGYAGRGWGFMDSQFQLVFEPVFDRVGDFVGPVTCACYKGQYGLLTLTGSFRPFKRKFSKSRFLLRTSDPSMTATAHTFGVFDMRVSSEFVSGYIDLEGDFLWRMNL